jgi:hypothetical protein
MSCLRRLHGDEFTTRFHAPDFEQARSTKSNFEQVDASVIAIARYSNAPRSFSNSTSRYRRTGV